MADHHYTDSFVANMATMNTKQYLPEKDYRLPDIDVLTMIFGEHTVQIMSVVLTSQTLHCHGQMRIPFYMLKQQILPTSSQKLSVACSPSAYHILSDTNLA